MARPFLRQLGVLTYSSGGVGRLELPRNHVFKKLICRLAGTINVTAAGTDVFDENPQSLLRDLRVVRNGSEVLQALDGGSLFQIGAINWGTPSERAAVASAAIASTAFVATVPIDFQSQGLWTPSMSLLRAVGTSTLVLEVTWGSENNIVVGGTKTFTVTPTLTVFGVEIMDVTGRFGDKILRPIERQITAATTDLEIQLPTGPLYRRLFFKVTTNDDVDLSDAIVNNLRIVVDGVLYLADRMTWTGLRAHNKLTYSLETLQSGYAVVDFTEDGNPQGLIVTAGASEVKVLADVAAPVGTTRLRVIPEQIIPAPVGG